MEKPAVNICIVHFNTPLLTECLVKSINKFTPNSKIYIFDNSDKQPFTYRQDNIIYFDNTNGQIINFKEWLKQFKNKARAGSGPLNGWASAKHCISVETCINLINDNFILLDSDVLLKKDISDLVSENDIWVGEIQDDHRNKIRVTPFLLYINVKRYKEKGYRFFNKKYMHGLSADGNLYDTAAYFYMITKTDKHKEISCSDYIVHYKAGSWVEIAKKYNSYKQVPHLLWLNQNRKYWKEPKKNKVVVYTAITGNYDNLLMPSYINDDFDYVCFTDNKSLESGLYEIRPIPDNLSSLSLVKQQRNIKVNPHLYLSDYDISIWIDGNIELLGNPLDLIDNDNYLFIPTHPVRDCLYEEVKTCIKLKKDTPENVNKQVKRYKKEGFPTHFGLPQSGIIIRYHNNKDCIKLMEDWWKEIENGSHRDQLSFSYVVWKNNSKICYLDKKIFKSNYFYLNAGHRRRIQRKSRNYVISSKNSSIQIERPNKVLVESTWNPIEQHPKKTVAKAPSIPKTVKNKNDRVVLIKRLFY